MRPYRMSGGRCSDCELPPRKQVDPSGGVPRGLGVNFVTRGRAAGVTLITVHLYEGKHPFEEDVAESGVAGVHKP
jgi:hypothetical protein